MAESTLDALAQASADDHGDATSPYPGLDFGPVELKAVMRDTYDELIDFITTPAFKAFHQELMALRPERRPAFVASVLFDAAECARRGIVVPDGILIQTSAFGDRRPTLFAVKKLLPERYRKAWENLNWTFSNDYDDVQVPRALETAWRTPLPVALQTKLIASGADLQHVPDVTPR